MGFAIAEKLADLGAHVELVSGPVHLSAKNNRIHKTDINTAEEMYVACIKIFPVCKGAILSAAVADFRPENVSINKIKKNNLDSDSLTLNLVKNKDILASLGTIKTQNQLLVGFSLETHDAEKYAKEKMIRKNCDFIVLNSLSDPGAGFSVDTNKISILTKNGETIHYGLKNKNEVAEDIVELIISRYF
jgi:phosphopantothenoylcysteine decarboxylase / phosphopantothenate---cysteine ligase